MKEYLRKELLSAGAAAVGFAKAGKIDKRIAYNFSEWIGNGMNADMDYLQRHSELRQHTDNVLKDAKTVITLAFSYATGRKREPELPMIASYAYVADYHKVIRKLLKPHIELFKKQFGGEWRICIDSAPVAERYWALKSGIGKLGKNGSVIVDGCGSYCFLAEILTTLEIEPDKATGVNDCGNCGACLSACPGKALTGDGTIDCRRCVSYLTIEKRNDFTEEELVMLRSANNGKGVIFGCDICLRVCPHNRKIKPAILDVFYPREDIMELTTEKIEKIDDNTFNKEFVNSSLKRIGLAGLKRNIAASSPHPKIDE